MDTQDQLLNVIDDLMFTVISQINLSKLVDQQSVEKELHVIHSTIEEAIPLSL